MKRKLDECQKAAKGMHDIWERVGEIWSNIDVESCRSLIRSTVSRVRTVLKEKESHMKCQNDGQIINATIENAKTILGLFF